MRGFVVPLSFLCLWFGALPASAQTTPTAPAPSAAPEAKATAKPPKPQKSLFDQPVLYPDGGRLSEAGVPEIHADVEGVVVAVRGFRSSNILYFEVEINNQSKADFDWVASTYRLTTDTGAALAQYSTSEVAKMLTTHATSPAPLQNNPNTASAYGATYGNGFPNGGYPSGARPGNATNGYGTPQNNPQSSVVLTELFAYGRDSKRRKREIEFAKALATGSATKAVVLPGTKQRFYLTFVKNKSKYYTFSAMPTAATPFTFNNDKPKHWQPLAQ